MTGGAFIVPPVASDDDDSDRDWDDGDADDGSSAEETQAIHVGPYRAQSGEAIQMTELGEAHMDSGMRSRNRRGGKRHVEWVGKPHVVGPEYLKMPLLTIGMLGLQCVWSIEMGYASPYLLELGLSKSLMSLVFVAGPLSGLIMQPLIGVLADRSQSRFGRRRPFMLAGCVVSVFAMMLLAWAREVAGWFGGGSKVAIGLAVWAIYLIDFSINAVQATDRALVVDILPPSQQEKGNAWAGRMFGTGSLAGFYVGNINLLAIFPILGKTQLQVLSFLTSVTVMVTHGLTAYSVKERVLLRDNRKSSNLSMKSTLHDIWKNIFTLPPAIRSICYAQFFAWIGWFPILFYTSVWVGEIYTREAIQGGRSVDDPDLPAEAVRAGSRALFMNAVVNLLTSVFLPFLVSSSGIRAEPKPVSTSSSNGNGGAYQSRSETVSANGFTSPLSGSTASEGLTVRASRLMQKLDKIRAIIKVPSRLRMQLPIRGFTLIRAWILGQAVFAGTMFATWFAGSVWAAQAIICVNGFCWGVAQWAPFSLLGELILLDSNVPEPYDKTLPVIRMIDEEGDDAFIRHRPSSRSDHRTYERDTATEEEEALITSTDEFDTDHPDHQHHHDLAAGRPGHSRTTTTSVDLTPSFSESRNRTPLGSRRTSRDLAEHALVLGKNGKSASASASASRSRLSQEYTGARSSFDIDLNPARDRLEGEGKVRISKSDESLYGSRGSALHPSNDFTSVEQQQDETYAPRQDRNTPMPNPKPNRKGNKGQGTAEKAGVILGIHNIFIVIPQFLVTFLSAIIFYIMEPTRPSLPEHHPTPNIPLSGNITLGVAADADLVPLEDEGSVNKAAKLLGRAVVEALRLRDGIKGSPRELEPHVTSNTDSVGFIFRLGGISAAIAGFMLYRMSKRFGQDPL